MSDDQPLRHFPYRFEGTAGVADVVARWAELAPGEESGQEVTVAGRIMLSRPQGKVSFADLRDSSGSIQLLARADLTADFEGLTDRNLGDWIGVRGEVIRVKRGELSIRVAEWVLLAEARQGFGDKWRGVSDVEIRYRQREVDLWANESSRRALLLRSRLVQRLRERLWAEGFVEVETPILHPIPGGAQARPFVTRHHALGTDFYLRIAPELYLKRLVVGGFEKVFEIGRMFRNEGLSPRHNPEFTLIEIYQAYADYRDLMVLVEELVAGLATDLLGTTSLTYQGRPLDLAPPWRRATLPELVGEATGLSVDVHTPVVELHHHLAAAGVTPDPSWGPGKLLFELYEKTTQDALWNPVFVCDLPAEVSPLARRHPDDPDLVERFEVALAGQEVLEGDSELNDPHDQRARFEEQAARRAAGDDEAMVVDAEYLRALEHGLPPTGGIGIGIDRLAMLFADAVNIREVIAFPTLRPGGPGRPAEHPADRGR